MGLKEAYTWKKIINAWFPSVQVNPEDVRSDVTIVIEDMCLRFYNYQKISFSLHRLFQEIRQHPGKMFAKFPRCSRYICLVDDPNDVPSSKRPTQQKRDDETFTQEELEVLGPRAFFSQLNEADVGWIEDMYAAEADAFNAKQLEKGNRERRNAFKVFMNKLMKTRSCNRKLDVYHTMGRELLKINKDTFRLLGLERVMILDGCALPEDKACRRLLSENSNIVADEFVSYIPGKLYPTDNVIIDSTRTVRSPIRYSLGEADVKIIAWMIAELERAQSPQTVWICCYDTDSIPIVLLNLYKLIDPKTGKIPHRVYLDLTYNNTNKVKVRDLSPEDQKLLQEHPELVSAWSQSTHVWDMVSFWRHIHTTFGQCFPGIKRPVETFCALLVLGATDFVTRLVDVGIAPLWEAFRSGGYSLLADAIKITHSEETIPRQKKGTLPLVLSPPRSIVFNEEALYRFTRYLYMIKLSCGHGVTGETLGFPSEVSRYLQEDLVEKIKGRGKGMRAHDNAFAKVLREFEASKSTLIIHGGDPKLSSKEAQERQGYFRIRDVYDKHYENQEKAHVARKAIRTASSHTLRPHLIRQRSFSLLPSASDILQGYQEAGSRKKSLAKKCIPTEQELRGYARRACWNLDYWYRGWHPDWEDRSIDVTQDGKSISGWAVTLDGEITRTNVLFFPNTHSKNRKKSRHHTTKRKKRKTTR